MDAFDNTPTSYIDNLKSNWDSWQEENEKEKRIKSSPFEEMEKNPYDPTLFEGQEGVPTDDELPDYYKDAQGKIDNRIDKQSKRTNKAIQRATKNPDRADKIMARNDRRAGRVDKKNAKDLDKMGDAGSVGGTAATMGVSALQEAPSIINNLSTDPTSSKEATGKILSMAASGASIGMAAGPWGAAIGAVVGAGAGAIDNIGWKGRLMDSNDETSQGNLDAEKNKRLEELFYNSTSKQLEQEQKMLSQSLGYTRIS